VPLAASQDEGLMSIMSSKVLQYTIKTVAKGTKMNSPRSFTTWK
jgi:hypothetical protein